MRKGTWEVYGGQTVNTTANFRAYKSVYHFYRDQDRLFQIARYARVRAAKTPETQAEALRLCGYATDPQYATKIIALIDSYGLRKYDEVKPEEDEDKLKLTESQTTMLVSALKRLVAAGTIGAEWVTKAEKGTLTISELTWLNTIVLARK